MRHEILLVVLVFSLLNCAQEKVTREVYVEPTLRDINLIGGVATFSHQIGAKRELYKIDEDRTISKVPFVFDGTPPNERQASAFQLKEINHPDYFLISFDSLKHTYFVEKKTGKVHKTLDFNIYYTNIWCTSKALYYYPNAPGNVHRITDYLSSTAQIETLPLESYGNLIVDKDETVFTRRGEYIDRYASGVLTSVLVDNGISAMWVGIDGRFRAMDIDGAIYRITSNTVMKEGEIPIVVGQVRTHNFPTLNKTIGFQYRYNRFYIIELTPPYRSVVNFPAPEPSEGETEEIHVQGHNGMVYIHSSSRKSVQRLLKVDVADFMNATNVVINSTDPAIQVLPLNGNFLLMSICVYSHFSCREQVALVSPLGEVKFVFDEGYFYGSLIRL